VIFQQGHRYRGAINAPAFTGSSIVKGRLERLGATDVVVYTKRPTGPGWDELEHPDADMWAEGTWPHPTKDVELPSRVVMMRDIGPVGASPARPPGGRPPASEPGGDVSPTGARRSSSGAALVVVGLLAWAALEGA
jgi:hypothetical protein